MHLTKTIRNLGLDTENQFSMVHLVCSLNLSGEQKQKLFTDIMEETEQKVPQIVNEVFEARVRKPQPKSCTLLGKPFSPVWRGSPPGMSKRDNEIWQRFLDKNEKKMLQVYYNVRVGTGTAPPIGSTPEECLFWIMNTMLRIDAVVERADSVEIVEVRPEAGRAAFGAAIMYKHFWGFDPKIKKPANAVILSDNIAPQIRACCFDHNVAYNVV